MVIHGRIGDQLVAEPQKVAQVTVVALRTIEHQRPSALQVEDLEVSVTPSGPCLCTLVGVRLAQRTWPNGSTISLSISDLYVHYDVRFRMANRPT